MKRHALTVSVTAALLLTAIYLSLPGLNAYSQVNGFIITNADATNTLSLTGSSTLTALIQTTAPRFVIEYANAKNVIPFTAPPTPFINLLQSAEDRFVLQYANASQTHSLTAPPAALVSLVQSVADRFVLQYANASQTHSLTYPVDLIGDTTAPGVVNVSTTASGDALNMTVQTDEYTRAQLEYGSSSGTYTETLTEAEYAYEHVFLLSGLQSGATYYYQLTVTDRSGNSTTPPEGTFTATSALYLPLVVK